MTFPRTKGRLTAAAGTLALSGIFFASPFSSLSVMAKPGIIRSHTVTRAATGGGTVAVTITATPMVIKINPAAPPTSEVLIARMTNRGPAPDARFGMKEKSRATYQIYALPRLDDRHHATMWKLVEVDHVSGTRTTVKEGWINDCRHGAKPLTPDADFYTCIHHPTRKQTPVIHRGAMATDFLTRVWRSLRAPADTTERGPNDPPWISCSTGCCTLES